MKKRVLSLLLVVVMLVSMLPMQAWAADKGYTAGSSNNVTITVKGADGEAITNATVEVTRSQNTYTVMNVGNGKYEFTKDRTGSYYTYNITVTAPGYDEGEATVKGSEKTAQVVLNKAPTYEPGNALNTIITVTVGSSDLKISNATVTVKKGTAAKAVYNLGDGQYAFVRDRNSSSDRYTVTVAAAGYTSKSVTVRGNTAETIVSLDGMGTALFDLYYIANGVVPSSYQGAGDAKNYGPSADNTPFMQMRVNLDMLRMVAQQENSPVKYLASGMSGAVNTYEFIPSVDRNSENFMAGVQAFWDAVLTCVDEESMEIYEATGLADRFAAYCLKNQGSASYPDLHCDGVLKVAEKAISYVVELYINNTYFGGAATDSKEKAFPTRLSLLEQFETRLGHNITWEEDANGLPELKNGQFKGTYVETNSNGNRVIYTVTISQRSNSGAVDVEGSEIPYVRQTDTYYLAQFDLKSVQGEQVEFLVTYTDGVTGEVIFNDHEYRASKNQTVPAFTGATIRQDYTFEGWYLEGSDSSTVYSDADIKNMKVTSDMTFHAVWKAVPRYEGRLHIVLDGKYDPATQTITEGEYVNPTTVGASSNEIYVSQDGVEFIQMALEKAGRYSAALKNGVYQFYILKEGQYVLASQQNLIIENQNRTRWLFYNSVNYDPNGGTLDGKTSRVEYYPENTSVNVYATAPVREGYIFLGWQTQHGTYQPGQLLDATLDHKCTLVAQWVKARNVYVHINLLHQASTHEINNDRAMHNVAFTLDTRPAGSAADYTEVYSKTITWDGASTLVDTDYSGEFANHRTVYTPVNPTRLNVRSDYEYTVTANKSGYTLEGVNQVSDSNGDLHITAVLRYTPTNFDFTYTVELDAEAKTLSPTLWPKAVNVKVISWYDTPNDTADQVDWYPITQHLVTYERLELDANGYAAGSYPVWQGTTDETPAAYHYRIEVVSYELQDGTVVSAAIEKDTNSAYVGAYASEHKRYFTDVEVTGGKVPANSPWAGAYWSYAEQKQAGTVKGIVHIPVYKVTFDANGGVLNVNGTDYTTANKFVLEKQIIMPDYAQYVPTRSGGYTFAGWELLDGTPVASGDALTRDVELVAKWIDPIRVEGYVTVGATYELEGDIKEIPEGSLPKTVTVLLQQKQPSGYYETINQSTVRLDYSQTAYYYQGRKVGVANYIFANLTKPKTDDEYRIYIMMANYHAAFQNEPESATNAWLAYDTYKHEDGERIALLGTSEPLVADVNAHMHFDPASFNLQYKVDATAIGEGFRPERADILITCDDHNPAVMEPSQWPVISQMLMDGVELPESVLLEMVSAKEYSGSDSFSVWINNYDGATAYDYGLRLQNVDGTAYTENPYYTVSYQAPAHFVSASGKQSQLLIAKLQPKQYAINYVLNGGTIFGAHPHAHTWSYVTDMTGITPVKDGYEFRGWYLDAQFQTPYTDTQIAADVAEDLTIYAKWEQMMDDVYLQVIIDHTAASGGVAGNYNKNLTAQLTQRTRGTTENFLPVDGQVKTYDKSYWHAMPSNAYTANVDDVLAVPQIFSGLSAEQDYSLNVALDGYYVNFDVTQDQVYQNGDMTAYTRVEKELHEDGSTTHHVYVYLKYEPELMDLQFSVRMAGDVDLAQYVVAADVKVTSWYDPPVEAVGEGWNVITQHSKSVVRVELENGKGSASGSYPVWQWMSHNPPVPYYYRMDVVALELADGTIIQLAETEAETKYTGSGYQATVSVTEGGDIPHNVVNGEVKPVDTTLKGIYGTAQTDASGVALVDAVDGSPVYVQSGKLEAVVDVGKVVFHANNPKAEGNEIFRTYYPAVNANVEGVENLTADGKVASFYEIPTFDYQTHNEYIFAGWYTAAENGQPISWDDVWTNAYDAQHVYAHWIATGEVAQENDGKTGIPNGMYQGYDLCGTQIRASKVESADHYGNVAPGLRFITSMSEDVYTKVKALSGTAAEYGFVIARASSADAKLTSAADLQYKGTNVNGVNTSSAYSFVQNMKCSGVVDHFDGEAYRLYTAVVTYNGLEGDALKAAQATEFLARSYMRYTDANGLLRTYYNNYTGNQSFSSCRTSWTAVNNILNPGK